MLESSNLNPNLRVGNLAGNIKGSSVGRHVNGHAISSRGSRRWRSLFEWFDSKKTYSIEDAVVLVKKAATAKFSESIDISVQLGVDTRKSDQVVKGSAVLPNGTGRAVRVAVFAEGDAAISAKEAGADIVGAVDLVDSIKAGNIDFDLAIAEISMMKFVGGLGKILGPKGLMPNPKLGTVCSDVALAVRNAKQGQVMYSADKSGVVRCSIGRANFEDSLIVKNVRFFIDVLKRAKPSVAKGVYIKKIVVSSTMGIGVVVDITSVVK